MKKQDEIAKEQQLHESATDKTNDSTSEIVDEVLEWKNKYLRALADYQNLEKRSFDERAEARKFASEVTLRKFIPAIDSLERAVKHIKDEGLNLSLKEFYAALSSCGVIRIETEGRNFDPFTMECLEVVEGKDGVVIEELLSGYMLYEKVLRVAQVKVGKDTIKK